MAEEKTKRSYYLPPPLADFFTAWCRPAREYSSKVGAGILLYMAVDPEVRAMAEKASAASDPESQVDALRRFMAGRIRDRQIDEYYQSLTDEQREILLFHVRDAGRKIEEAT